MKCGSVTVRVVAVLLFGIFIVAGGHMLADGLRRLQRQALQEDVYPEPDGGSYVVRP